MGAKAVTTKHLDDHGAKPVRQAKRVKALSERSCHTLASRDFCRSRTSTLPPHQKEGPVHRPANGGGAHQITGRSGRYAEHR